MHAEPKDYAVNSFKDAVFSGGTAATTAEDEKAFRGHLSQNLLYHYSVKKAVSHLDIGFLVFLESQSSTPLPACPPAPEHGSKACSTRD